MPEVEKELKVEGKIKSTESLGLIDEIKKGIDEIRNGIRENIASVWDGFKGLLGRGFKKLLGIPVEAKEQPSSVTTATEPENSETQDKKQSDNDNSKDTEQKKEEVEEVKIQEADDFKKIIEQFQKEIDQPIKTVCYPACGYMSINDTFKDAKVTYIDIDEDAIKLHQDAGHTAIKADLGEYKPKEKPDLTIFMNPAIKEDKLKKYLENVEKGKYIITNNYHRTADYLYKDPSFELLGVFPPDESNMDKEKPEKYFDQKYRDEQKSKFTAHKFVFKRKKEEAQPIQQAA